MEQYKEYKDSGVKWIGKIPRHWGIESFGRHFSYGKGLLITKADLKEYGVAVISYGQIHAKNNTGTTLSETLTRRVDSSFLETNPQCLLEKNDFIFADTSEDINGCGNYCFNDYDGIIFAGYHTVVARPNNLQYPKYYAYLMQSVAWKLQIQTLVNGVKVYSINKGILKKSSLLIPTITEQQEIASYLDNKVSKIDKYISTAEKKIAALDELKQVTIADAVTHGINPDVPMKNSGIPWIGMVPEHWTRARYKDIFNIEDEKVGKRNDLTLLSLTKKGVIVRDLSEGKGKFPKDYESYKVVNPNNIILCLFDVDETPRTVGVSHNKGMITGAYDIFEIKNAKLEFIYYLYLSIDDKKGFKSLYKGLRKVIPLPSLLSAYINLPPISEQNEILAYIDRKVAQIDKMKAAELAQIEKLKEYKQRLISDVVTGKVKVTNE